MSDTITQLIQRIEYLNKLGIELSTEKDYNRLLENILLGAKEITNADGGTLYLLTEDRHLKMEILRTDSLNFAMGGTTGKNIPFEPIPLYLEDGSENLKMVVTSAVLKDQTINIADAYNPHDYDFSGTYAFDKNTGYRSTSFLTIPMKNHENDIIGVLQLINAHDDNGIREFSESDQQLVQSLASQAAIALTNKQLIDGMKELFDSLVKMIASAIDEKSAHTGNHCRKIPLITMSLAEAANHADYGSLKDFSLHDDQRYELETAAWLHDCGKLTTPDKVMEKATKLEKPLDRIELVKLRGEIMKRDALIQIYQQHLNVVDKSTADRLLQSFNDVETQISDDITFLERANMGSEFMSDEYCERVEQLSKQSWLDQDKQSQPLLDDDEKYNLTIRKGTLTQEERDIINNHISVTIKMLESLPFPKHMRNIPEFAGGHHERVDGTGFPRGLTGEQMSIPAKVMAIADIFEALTANDRPYKKPMKLSLAMKILKEMSETGHIDPALFEVFVKEKVYMDYARDHLSPEQIDID